MMQGMEQAKRLPICIASRQWKRDDLLLVLAHKIAWGTSIKRNLTFQGISLEIKSNWQCHAALVITPGSSNRTSPYAWLLNQAEH